MTVGYKKLNMSKLNDRKRQIISSSDALKEITPINWSKEIQDGKKKNQLPLKTTKFSFVNLIKIFCS